MITDGVFGEKTQIHNCRQVKMLKDKIYGQSLGEKVYTTLA